MSIVCIAITSGPVKHSTYLIIFGKEQYWLKTGSNYSNDNINKGTNMMD